MPLAFHLTPGQASDSRQFEILLDLGPDIAPRAAVGDKGYDAKANRAAARKRGICPVIPVKSSAKERPAFFPKALYRARARIEQLMGKLKRFKRIALRCEKTHRNFGSFVAFALGLIILKSVHTAQLIKRDHNVEDVVRGVRAIARAAAVAGALAAILIGGGVCSRAPVLSARTVTGGWSQRSRPSPARPSQRSPRPTLRLFWSATEPSREPAPGVRAAASTMRLSAPSCATAPSRHRSSHSGH